MDKVPTDKVCEVVLSYIADGATKIVLTKNGDGTWTIEAS